MTLILGTRPTTTINVNIGTPPRNSGTFTITGSFNTALPVLITYTPTNIDDAEWDIINVVGYVVDSTTIKCYWNSVTNVSGTKNFTYRQV